MCNKKLIKMLMDLKEAYQEEFEKTASVELSWYFKGAQNTIEEIIEMIQSKQSKCSKCKKNKGD